MKIILGSASPRRKELLKQIVDDFIILVSNVDESIDRPEKVEDIPYELYWCPHCKVPLIKAVNSVDKEYCPLCGNNTEYMAQDIRPVFPEERLLLEILLDKPLAFIEKNVWASNNRYYIDGEELSCEIGFRLSVVVHIGKGAYGVFIGERDPSVPRLCVADLFEHS